MQSLPSAVRPIHRAPKWLYTVHLLLLSRSFSVINDLQIPQTFHFIWSWHTKRMTTRTKANWHRERERGTGGLQWCVLNWNRMLKLSKHCSAGDLFSALPRGPLLYTRIDRQTEGCSVAIGKWFWVIYFIVALKYLLFWKAPNNAMINLKGLPCPPLATPPSCHSWLRVEQVWRTNPLKIPCGHVPKPNQFFFSFLTFPPVPLAPTLLLPLAVGATYLVLCGFVLFIRIGFVFVFAFVLESHFPRCLQSILRQSGLWGRYHAHPPRSWLAWL